MIPLLLVAQLSLTLAVLDVRPTAPPLPPAEAAATLRRASQPQRDGDVGAVVVTLCQA